MENDLRVKKKWEASRELSILNLRKMLFSFVVSLLGGGCDGAIKRIIELICHELWEIGDDWYVRAATLFTGLDMELWQEIRYAQECCIISSWVAQKKRQKLFIWFPGRPIPAAPALPTTWCSSVHIASLDRRNIDNIFLCLLVFDLLGQTPNIKRIDVDTSSSADNDLSCLAFASYCCSFFLCFSFLEMRLRRQVSWKHTPGCDYSINYETREVFQSDLRKKKKN